MLIDFHTHLSPPSWGRGPMPPALTDLDGYLAQKEADGIDRSVLINAMINLPGSPVDNLSLPRIREWNEFAAELVESHKDKLTAFVGINPFGDDEMLDELRAAVGDGPFSGVAVTSSVDGEYLDSTRARDFWEQVAELDVPVFIHPTSTPPAHAKEPGIQEFIARAQDVALSVSGLVYDGLLDRHPSLTLICGAGAGGLAGLAGRLDAAARYGRIGGGPPKPGEGHAGQAEPAPEKRHAPTEVLRRIFVDTCVFNEAALLCNVTVFGADRVVFGTDFPPVNIPARATLDLIAGLPIGDEDKEAIRWRNGAQLLQLDTGS